jgi:hypothetical protein
MAQENISAQLNDLLISRNFDPDMLDYQGKPAAPEDTTVFSFDYESSTGQNYGTMVIVLDDDSDMQVFYGDNLGRGMEPEDKSEFFDFIQHLHKFANMRRWTFSPKDITRVKHTMQGLAAIKEGLFEGYYGNRRISYSGEPTDARLVIKHNRPLGENDARYRYVESLFIETADSERFRLPFKYLAGARAMLEHVRQGGRPYDIRGSHITEMVTELATLSRFNRASRGRILEGATAELVTGAQSYYQHLRESLKKLSTGRGYNTYFESWSPADISEQEELVESIKTLFIEQTIDSRIEQALPLLAKIQKETSMKEVGIFENWVEQVSEGTWAIPDTPEQIQRLKELMSSELTVGPDATNATELLYDLVGDDELFDQLQAIAQDNPDADVRDVVQQRLQQLGIDLGNEPGVGFSDETGEMASDEVEDEIEANEAFNPYDATSKPDVDPDDREQAPVGFGSSPPLQRSPEQQREFDKMMNYLNRDRGVAESEDPLARLKSLALRR